MTHSSHSRSMSPHQISLLQRALLIVTKIDEGGWHEIPEDLRIPFAKYMDPEAWTHLPDLLSLREAALMVVRDAIARTGEFAPDAADEPAHDEAPGKVLTAR